MYFITSFPVYSLSLIHIFMVGGAPVNDSFAKKIGADYYTPDAATAAEVARNAVLTH